MDLRQNARHVREQLQRDDQQGRAERSDAGCTLGALIDSRLVFQGAGEVFDFLATEAWHLL